MIDAGLLFKAAKEGNEEEIKKLLGSRPAKADVDVKDKYKRTALFFAILGKQWSIAILLLKAPYNADATVKCACCNTTALSKAAEYGAVDVVKLLMFEGASVTERNKNNESAATLAERFGYPKCVMALNRTQEATVEELEVNAVEQLVRTIAKSNGLNRFYGGDNEKAVRDAIRPKARTAAQAAHDLLDAGYDSLEDVERLSILALYDLVVLLDDSYSMTFEEMGHRTKAMEKTLKAIVKIYSSLHAPTEGVRAVRFLNSKKRLDNLGRALRKKILEEFAEDFGDRLANPLLVVVITDGAIENEHMSVIEDTIEQYATAIEQKWGRHAIAFQFARIGNNAGAKAFLHDLDASSTCGKYVSVDAVGLGLSDLLETRSRKRRRRDESDEDDSDDEGPSDEED
ncbi:ankyrin repeat-containing domain protein [Xylariaceae sp. FL0594]|nr:ankyrin repeat-containing domain protein [Xylariaceae sp. FL0594]